MRPREHETQGGPPPLGFWELLAFRPWMLALAVFLACAIGITIMEQVRDANEMWAQATPAEATGR